MSLNVDLLRQVREKIATTPEAYDQSVLGRVERAAPCGTAACIAGWACVLAGKFSLDQIQRTGDESGPSADEVWDAARVALRLTSDEADTLFTETPAGFWMDFDDDGNDVYEDGWPDPYASDWRELDPTHHPRIALAYLDSIIETGDVLVLD